MTLESKCDVNNVEEAINLYGIRNFTSHKFQVKLLQIIIILPIHITLHIFRDDGEKRIIHLANL